MAEGDSNGGSTAATIQTDEETDNLARSTKKVKVAEGDINNQSSETNAADDQFSEGRRKTSYKEKVTGPSFDKEMGNGDVEDFDDNVFDDDEVVEDDMGPWFSMGMTKQEKIDA